MLNIFSTKIDAFALNFSDTSLKVVQLGNKKGRSSRFIYGQADIPEGVVEQGEIKKENELAALIKKTISGVNGGKIKSKYVAVSLPEEKSFVDVLRLPNLKKGEVGNAVLFEAANYIPIPLDEVYFDFEVVKRSALNKVSGAVVDKAVPQGGSLGESMEVLIAATPKKIVDSYASMLKIAGLKPFFMEVESLSLSRALIKQGVNHRPLLIIDFGQFRTVFVIFAGQSLRFSSTIPVASKELDNLLMKQLNINLAEAEKIKQTEGLWGDSKILDIIVPVLTDLTEQIKKHLDYYHSHSPLNHVPHFVEKIVLCGGGANLKGLASFLTDALKIRIELGNPWVNVFSSSHKEILPVSLEESVSYATAIGLALSVSLYD